MSVAPEFYIPKRSWLHAADPRAKLLLVSMSVAILLVFQNMTFMIAALLAILLVHLSAGVPRDRIIFLFKALLPVTLLMPLIWVIFYPEGEVVFTVAFINIRVQSLAQGLTVALRIHAVALAIFALLFTTDQNSLVQGLVRLRVPYSWGLVLSLALRYIPNFAGSYSSILQAQQARGYEFEGERGLKRVRALMPILVPMVIDSFRASEQIGIALEARGFGVRGMRRTFLNEIRYRPMDWWLTGMAVLGGAALLALNLRLGFGVDPLAFFP